MSGTVTFPWLPAGAAATPSSQWSLEYGVKEFATLFALSGLVSPPLITTSWMRVGNVVTSIAKGTWDRSQWISAPVGNAMFITGIFPPQPNDYGELAKWSFTGLVDDVTPAHAQLSGDGAALFVHDHSGGVTSVLTPLLDTMIETVPGGTTDIFSLQLTYTSDAPV